MLDQYLLAVEIALNDGFKSIEVPDGSLPLLERALKQRVGQISQTQLSVRTTDEAKRNTLSEVYGEASFPHHTDFAFRPFPPRVIVLVNQTDDEFEAPTMVSRLKSLPNKALEVHARSRWRLKSKGRSFVVGGITNLGNHIIHRWDTTFFEPENSAAWLCVHRIAKVISQVETIHKWAPRTALIIDNWNCTHARSYSGGDAKGKRLLLRLEGWHHAGVDG